MDDGPRSGRIAVLSRSWGDSNGEAAFVARQLASAMSRSATVDVVVPGPPGPTTPDGAFDLHPVGGTAGAEWPEPARAVWPGTARPQFALVDAGDEGGRRIVEQWAPAAVVLEAGALVAQVGLHVGVNPLAAVRRHNGIGATGYVLVLSDRVGTEEPRRPTPLVAWLTARFTRRLVVVVEDAMAAVWRARALRGVVGVDTRTDLWRLMAHAQVMVDLRPGPLVARECVEAQRFGTPIVVPSGTAAADLAAGGGGLWFDDVAGLLGCVDAVDDPGLRDTLGAQGREVADRRYGHPDRFVARVAEALAQAGVR